MRQLLRRCVVYFSFATLVSMYLVVSEESENGCDGYGGICNRLIVSAFSGAGGASVLPGVPLITLNWLDSSMIHDQHGPDSN